MQSTSTLRRHARLFTDMAEAQGVDLEEAVLRARILPDDIAEGVLRCTGCASPDDCEAALADGRAGEIPGYCRNAAMLTALRDMG
ncbi:MAG: DUF6455 family protein [Paracoccaceae bacterium]|nr:DUF6455 family protein [Paracoccaceae bacterium]